jgi:hypothetical protein
VDEYYRLRNEEKLKDELPVPVDVVYEIVYEIDDENPLYWRKHKFTVTCERGHTHEYDYYPPDGERDSEKIIEFLRRPITDPEILRLVMVILFEEVKRIRDEPVPCADVNCPDRQWCDGYDCQSI